MQFSIRSLAAAAALTGPLAVAAQAPVKDHPGVVLDVAFDANGDHCRESLIVKVVTGEQVVTATLPAVGK